MLEKCTFSEKELSDWIAKRRASAFPIMPIPKNDNRYRASRILYSISVSILRIQMQGIRHALRCSKDPATREKQRLRASKSIPVMVAREKERIQNDPNYREYRRRIARRHYQKNKEKIRIRVKQTPWYKNHKKEYGRKYLAKRRAEDLGFRIRNRLSSRLWHAVMSKHGTKAYKTMELVGCSIGELKSKLESRFTCGMTWDKFRNGEIHIDHIKPCAKFDLTDAEQQKLCFHYSNLQPLWAFDNLSKKDR